MRISSKFLRMPPPGPKLLAGLIPIAALLAAGWGLARGPAARPTVGATPPSEVARPPKFQMRMPVDLSGYGVVVPAIQPWRPDAPLEEIAESWRDIGHRFNQAIDRHLASDPGLTLDARASFLFRKALLFHYEGEPAQAYECFGRARALVEADREMAERWLYTLIYSQGVASMRRGENENCISCRGESSCILPIAPAAVHTRPDGSRTAIKHFTEYLGQFPDDLEVRWLLNLAHMTLGEYPDKVDPRYLVSLDRYRKSEFDIGKFRDIGHLAGVDRYNQAGGAIMDDFDDDGRLDLVVTSWDATEPMALYRNKGDGTFEDRTAAAGVANQLGGLYCVQADYNNDGHLDIYIARGAWIGLPIRPSLLRNNGDGTFTDVTEEAGLLDPVNSNSASWCDYDNDGFVDLFVCCEKQTNRLYRNQGDGTFVEVSAQAGLLSRATDFCKGSAWLDFNNDRHPDLFVNTLASSSRLYLNEGNGRFTEVTSSMGIDGPRGGFSCWAWDYDNDGWLDIFATCYDRTMEDVVRGLLGRPHRRHSNRLYRNLGGKGFEDRTKEAGLDVVYASMGSNYGDFDNDGYLDMFLGTGEPNLATLIPDRMIKNVAGRRFADITGSSGTGHLQKGHGVACGDWDRDGSVDLFVQMGGATNGDKYHNVLFQNPGQGNHWLSVKLVGKKTNRAAIGARIKVVTAGKDPLTVHRHVSSGSSFGANPLEQTVGLGTSDRVATLEVYWPTSDTTQVFRDIPAGRAIEVTEFAKDYRVLDRKPIPEPR